MLRVLGSIVLALAAALALVGCTGESPDPSPTATALFETDEEAFAAAEATYRAYVDALNAVDLSDPETFEAVYAWTTGDAQAAARESFTQMHADGWVVTGDSVAKQLSPETAAHSFVRVLACLDVSAVQLVDAQGESKVSDDRPDVQPFIVTMVQASESATGLRIDQFEGGASDQCL